MSYETRQHEHAISEPQSSSYSLRIGRECFENALKAMVLSTAASAFVQSIESRANSGHQRTRMDVCFAKRREETEEKEKAIST